MPSDIDTNEYITPEKAGTENLSMFWAEEEFGDDLSMWLLNYITSCVRYLFSLFFPLQSNSENIKYYPEEYKATIDAKNKGVLLGKYSYRLFQGTVDENTFALNKIDYYLPTGIQVNLDDDDIITDPSIFKITLDFASNDAGLADIKIDNQSIENFDKSKLEYELEILEEKKEIYLNPILSDEKASMNVKVKELSTETDKEILFDVESESYKITLNGVGEESKIEINVTAEDEETTKTYYVTIKQVCGVISGSISTINWDGIHIGDIKIFEKGVIEWEELYGHDDLPEALKTVKTNDDGTYEVRMVPGTYDILIDKPGYLDYIFINVKIEKEDEIDFDNIELIAGDANKDGFISFEDLTYINIYYGIEIDDENYSEAYDFEGKAYVGFEDITCINQNYDNERTIVEY